MVSGVKSLTLYRRLVVPISLKKKKLKISQYSEKLTATLYILIEINLKGKILNIGELLKDN